MPFHSNPSNYSGPHAHGPLPCHNDVNNCAGFPPIPPPDLNGTSYYDPQKTKPVTPSHRKKARHAFNRNFWAFIQRYGLKNCGHAVLRFDEDIDSKEAQARLRAAQRFLRQLFEDYIFILDFDESGHPHYHLLVAVKHDIRTGYAGPDTLQLDDLWRRIKRGCATEDDRENYDGLRRCFTANPYLRGLWRLLRERLPDYRFGMDYPCQLVPVCDPRRLRAYLSRKFACPFVDQPRYVKGTRTIAYRRDSPARVANTNFGWNTPETKLERRKKQAMAQALDVDEAWFKQWCGRQWHRRMLQWIAELDLTRPGWYEAPAANRGHVRNVVFAAIPTWERPM